MTRKGWLVALERHVGAGRRQDDVLSYGGNGLLLKALGNWIAWSEAQ